MATAAAEWSRQPLQSHSSNIGSKSHPDRPIRPLPKTSIRSRLSGHAADSIVYPPVLPSSSPSYGSPQSQSERSFTNSRYPGDVANLPDEHDDGCDCKVDHSESRSHHPSGPESDVDEGGRKVHRYASRHVGRENESGTARLARQEHTGPRPAHRVPSTSSADGYESFENTNNKKKRKIPISGPAGASSDVASMNIPTQSVDVSNGEDPSANVGQYYGSGQMSQSSSSGMGMSGPGRGRTARNVRAMYDRKPLGTSANAQNAYSGTAAESDIISTAIEIANATHSNLPIPQGQENESLLKQQSPGSTDQKNFTFECPSETANKLGNPQAQALPGVSPRSSMAGKNAQTAAQGTLAADGVVQSRTNTTGDGNPVQQSQSHQAAQSNPPNQPLPPVEQPKQRSLRQTYKMAARQRERDQAWENRRQFSGRGEFYLCSFCEYEMLFGQKPLALIYKYEERDYNERVAREKNLRRLEQAKAKSRKGKKGRAGTKSSAANSGLTNPPSATPYDPQYDLPDDVDSNGEEFFDDNYDENGQLDYGSPIDNQFGGSYAPGSFPADNYLDHGRTG